MNTLIVATSATPTAAQHEIAKGQRQRIDYLELPRLTSGNYVDFASVAPSSRLMGLIENKSRIDIHYAIQVARVARARGYETVFSLSERVGIPLAYLLPVAVRHVVQLHHPLSRIKMRSIQALRIPGRWHTMIVYTQAELQAVSALLGEEAAKVRHVRHPVDTMFFTPDDVSPKEGQAVSVGLSHRDYPTLLRALQKVPQVTCDIYASSTWIGSAMVGGGESVPVNVRLRAQIPPRELKGRYSASQFAIVPVANTTQWSAGVNAVLEAQAMARPVIASRTPGMAEYVVDGETGLLVAQGNPAEMAEAMNYLSANPKIAAGMGRRAREWVEMHFSLDRWLSEVSALLLESTSGSTHPVT